MKLYSLVILTLRYDNENGVWETVRDENMKLPGRGIVFKDHKWELYMFLTHEDGFTPLEGVPAIPIGDSEEGITKSLTEHTFYFVKWRAMHNETTRKMVKEAEENEDVKINMYRLLCCHNYILKYSTLRFTLDHTVLESMQRGDFWESVKDIYENEKIEF